MSSETPIPDHQEIRCWADENAGQPAGVRDTGKGDEPGNLRLDFDARRENLEESDRHRRPERFGKNELALLRSFDDRSNELVQRKG